MPNSADGERSKQSPTKCVNEYSIIFQERNLKGKLSGKNSEKEIKEGKKPLLVQSQK